MPMGMTALVVNICMIHFRSIWDVTSIGQMSAAAVLINGTHHTCNKCAVQLSQYKGSDCLAIWRNQRLRRVLVAIGATQSQLPEVIEAHHVQVSGCGR